MFAYVPQNLHICLLLRGTPSFVRNVSFFSEKLFAFIHNNAIYAVTGTENFAGAAAAISAELQSVFTFEGAFVVLILRSKIYQVRRQVSVYRKMERGSL